MDIIPTRVKCGCSSVVEHLLAKEDVASSNLVTRSIRHGGLSPLWNREGAARHEDVRGERGVLGAHLVQHRVNVTNRLAEGFQGVL